ncbi:MAG: hypothetical protein MJ157_00350 [Clostridia bacterium]|nr:hypothetical protein [Clostridia bacterium]
MILEQVKQRVLGLVQFYFGEARVIWGGTNFIRPNLPLVELRLLAVSGGQFPNTAWTDGEIKAYYPAKATWEIILHTPGEMEADVPGQTVPTHNCALNDLLDFGDFLNSPFALDWSSEHNLTLFWTGKVEDISQVINDLRWEYRARAVFEVEFIRESMGQYGLVRNYGWKQTASGGGRPTPDNYGYFSRAEIEEN